MVKYGNTLESSRKDGRLANTDNIYDKRTGEMQEAINQKIANLLHITDKDISQIIDGTYLPKEDDAPPCKP